MTLKDRVPVYIILLALVLLFGWFSIPQVDYRPHGIFLPSEQYATLKSLKPVDPASVIVSDHNSVQGVLLGMVNTESVIKGPIEATEEAALMSVKQIAAQNGANRIVISEAFMSPEDNLIVLQANAYHA
jgi:hypothetical protein